MNTFSGRRYLISGDVIVANLVTQRVRLERKSCVNLTYSKVHFVVFRKNLSSKLFYAFPTEPKSSIFSLTVALIASVPGASNLRGSNPLPSKSLPASTYVRVAAANDN